VAEIADIFARVRGYQQQNQARTLGGLDQYSGRFQSVRDAYQARLDAERQKAVGTAGGGYESPGAMADSDLKALVEKYATKRGWTGGEWNALSDLIQRESGWNAGVKNPNSSAWGLFQFLKSTAANYGIPWGTANPQQQTVAGLQYIADRHGLARVPINGRDVGNWY
jgi:hypothetical protein